MNIYLHANIWMFYFFFLIWDEKISFIIILYFAFTIWLVCNNFVISVLYFCDGKM